MEYKTSDDASSIAKFNYPKGILSVEELKKLPLGELLLYPPILELERISYKMKLPPIVCKDGTKLSVQASKYHYCEPRDDTGPYVSAEVGFPSVAPPESWNGYCEDLSSPTQTVYANVPVDTIAFFIGAHGGIDYKKSFGKDVVI